MLVTSRRRALRAIGIGTTMVLAGCQALDTSGRPFRYAVELRNYANQSIRFHVNVEGDAENSIWTFEKTMDSGSAVNETFQGSPTALQLTVGDEEKIIGWKRTECDDRPRASTAQIHYGANTEMDEMGIQFRCENLDAKYPNES